jgi:tetratricopeptide (TPR) repeat protein
VIYCINPYCKGRENLDEAECCASCMTPLLVNNRLKLVNKISSDSDIEVFTVIESRNTFSGVAGSHKILKVLKSVNPERVKVFQTEGLILQSLHHNSVPKVDALYDSFDVELAVNHIKLHCLVMSKFEGITLESYVLKNGAISQKLAIEYIRQIASVLDYIHTVQISDEGGVIHRDIKPENIIVQPSGELALIDFGYALIMNLAYQSRLGSGLGEATEVETVYYTPPEQIARRPIPQSDFFALGMTIIFAVTGRQLYDMEMKSWQPQWQQYAKHLDKVFIQFLERMTNPEAFKRPSTVDEILNIVTVVIPSKLIWKTRIRSTPYRIALIAIATLIVLVLFQVGRNGLYEYYFTNGKQAVEDNHFENARQQFEAAINTLPKAEAYSNLGVVCSRLGDFNCSLRAYQNAIKLSPKGWEGYYQLGSYYEENERPEVKEAEKNYRKALSINSQAIQPLNNLARVLILQKRYDEAKPLLMDAIKFSSEPYYKSIINKNLGWLYLEKKQYLEAEKYLKMSIDLDSTLVSPHCLLAKLYELQKKSSDNEIESCLIKNGEDFQNMEVIKWRNKIIQNLIRKQNRSTLENIYVS